MIPAVLAHLAPQDAHRPFPLRTDDPAEQWILGLFVAWRDLQDDGGGSISGADLVGHLDEMFTAIGLDDDTSLLELAAQCLPPREPRCQHSHDHDTAVEQQ
ncbi:hypothetical protein FRP1_30240 (plasmid) [Pseudonocardia sp. EC080625-04]|nr:hypothetical protein FRP1_30240 [Pseudonocardia sp. EC080625-04]ALL85903.1 hypothetical protein AD017_32915 [Pseudonocardia sp. EC080619-01]